MVCGLKESSNHKRPCTDGYYSNVRIYEMPASVTIWHFEEANLLEKGSRDRHTYSIQRTCCKHFQACSTPPFDQKWYLAAFPFPFRSD